MDKTFAKFAGVTLFPMRIIISSMPMIALVAILSASASRRIDQVAKVNMNMAGQALPESTAIIRKARPELFRAKSFLPLARPKKAELDEFAKSFK
jgi:hypothetical protein